MRIPVEDDAQLSQEELSRLAGQAAVAAAAAPAQRPGSPVATCGACQLWSLSYVACMKEQLANVSRNLLMHSAVWTVCKPKPYSSCLQCIQAVACRGAWEGTANLTTYAHVWMQVWRSLWLVLVGSLVAQLWYDVTLLLQLLLPTFATPCMNVSVIILMLCFHANTVILCMRT
jgi:hypothetical protein